MYKREKCFIKTKKQHVSFVVGTFLSLQRERIYGLQIAWTSFALENTKPVVSIVIMTTWTQGAGIAYLENLAQGTTFPEAEGSHMQMNWSFIAEISKPSPLPQLAKFWGRVKQTKAEQGSPPLLCGCPMLVRAHGYTERHSEDQGDISCSKAEAIFSGLWEKRENALKLDTVIS